MCQICAKLIDNDPERYLSELLRERKRGAEERALASVSGATSTLGEVSLSSSAALLAGEVDRLAGQMSETVDQDLERMISAWREGRTGEAGGYAAGRMPARSGLKHGLFVPLLNLLVVIVLAILGELLGVSFIDQLGGVALPQEAQQQAPQNVGTILSISGVLALLFPFVGGAIGGALGARTGRRRP